MYKSFLILLSILLVTGCGKSVPRDELEKDKPGYKVAKTYCSQCHTLPFSDQHTLQEWPAVIARMKGYIQSARRKMPNDYEEIALLGYFQSP